MKKKLRMSNLLRKTALYLILFGLSGTSAFADGSKDLFPSGATGVRAFLMSSSNAVTFGWPYTTLGIHYAYVKEGERIAAASSVQRFTLGRIILTAPDGQVYNSADSPDKGEINSRVQELAGPNVDGVTTGYVPFTQVAGPGQEGLWTISFLPASNPANISIANVYDYTANINWTTTHQTSAGSGILAWDVSVISNSDKLIPGRVYSNVMNMATNGRYYGKLFVLTNDGYVYKVSNNGMDPRGFCYFVNNKGLTSGTDDNAEPIYKSIAEMDNLSIKDPRTPDGVKSITHKLFYSYPDASMPVAAQTAVGSTWLRVPKIIPVVTNIAVTGIEGTPAQVSSKGALIKFNANMSGRYRINLEGPAPFVSRSIVGNADSGPNQVLWDGKDGDGKVLTAGTATFTVMVQLQGAEVHFPFIDVEHNVSGIIIEQLNDDGTLKMDGDIVYWDDSDLPIAGNSSNPRENGNDGTGISSNANGHKWSTGGGDNRTMDTWAYVLGDLVSQDATVTTKVADLAIPSITPNVTEAKPGTEIIYTVPVINHGPSDITGAPFKFKVPTGFSIANISDVTFTMDCGTALVNSAAIDADGDYTALLDLPDGCTITFSIKGKLNAAFSGANVNVEASIMRPADVTDPDATNPDPAVLPTDPHIECLNGTAVEGCNNIKYNAIPVASTADVVMVKSTTATEYIPGEEVEYTLTVRNDGPGDAKAVTVTDQAPAGTTISSWVATVTSGAVNLDATSGTGDLNQEILVLPNAAVVTYTLTLTVDANHTADLVNTAMAISSETVDPNENNNTSTTAAIVSVPNAPLSSGNQMVCATIPVQTLTAMATIPAGITITWYDAPKGGAIVNPVLNTLGTVVFYAEANNGSVKSKSRTAVVLSINASPVIDPIADLTACETYELPPITGTNLTGNEAYYTEQNGGGTKYLAGTVLNTVGTQTLYIYDKVVSNKTCAGDIAVTANTSLSNNVFLHQILSPHHHFYPGSVSANFWKGTASQPIEYYPSGATQVYLSLVGDLNISEDPACTEGQVEIMIGATFKNEGPSAGVLYSGHVTIANKVTGDIVYTNPIQNNFPVGVEASYTASAIVPAADLLSGNLVIIFGAETKQGDYKSWTISDFKATYNFLSEVPCPAEQSFQLTINPLPDAPISEGNQIVCATNPIQVLTATATVPAGTAIIWYDALVDGNVVAMPTLNTIGSVTYYAEAVSNNCSSSVRTPVSLTLVETPEIDPILDQSSCGPFTLPAIIGANLSGNQAYYTEINKGGTRYEPGDIISTLGETTLYAYDESTNASAGSAKAALELERDLNYTSAKLLELFPDNSRAFGRSYGGTLANGGALTSLGAPTGKYNVMVGKLTLPSGYSNAEEYVQVSVEEGWFRIPTYPSGPPIPGYAGQIAIINTATNQLLYQTLYNDLPGEGVSPTTVAGLVPTSDLIAGNIGIFMELKGSIVRISEVSVQYQFLSNEMTCPAQQSFKVTINEIPDAPISGGDQEVCAMSTIQTLTATAKAAAGSTVKWYDALTDGTEIASPILNAVGSVTYYAEAYNGSCASATRTAVTLTINESPVLSIHNPAVVCHPGLVDLTDATITNGSTAGLDLTYFEDANATVVLLNPSAVDVSGTYYIKGTNSVTGCSAIAPVVVQFVDKPEVVAVHPDCVSGTGSISIASPLGVGFEYSINGGAYSSNPVFENLAPGTYEIRASNSVVPGCESDVTTVVINSTPITAMPLVIQPDCDQPLGTIVFPVNAAYEYSINDGVSYTVENEFIDLAPGTYLVRSKKAGDACIADAVEVIIVASESRPAQPVSLGDIQVCETNGAQTITAEVTTDAGVTIVWYDALTSGNIVSSPTLSTVGSITFYAEANNGVCTSTNRTPVTLTIAPLPVIYPINDINVCGDITLPAISGLGLSATAAYYTQPGGGGDKYNVGDVFSALGQSTLYSYDVSVSGCSVEQAFDVFIQSVTEGVIGVDQTICKNTVPLPLGSITDGTGSNIKYRWEKSTTSASTGFTVISGIVSATYAPFIPLNTTTYFRRIAVSTLNGVICESAPTAVVAIMVQDVVMAGEISADQTICHGSIPAPLTSVSTGTGSGIISYRWESSTTDALTDFTAISSAVSADYNPGALNETTYFRRIAISTENGTTCESAPAPAIKITVQDVVTEGAISGDQTICNGSIPSPLTSVSTSTGSGTITYRWESSTTDAVTDFTVISGAVKPDYEPGALTESTYFRRIAISTENGMICESVPTTAVKINVQDVVTAGAIGTNQTICTNSVPVALSSLTNGTGSGTISYRWEKSSASAPAFAAITGETLSSYSPGALTETTWFRRISISSLSGVQCESVPTALIEITVQGVTSPGAIAAIQTICNGNIPEPLTSITAGTGSGTITYRWESSTTDALSGFTSIPTATAANYAPAALSTTTWFRRIAISTVSGSTCESVPTAAVAINVQEPVTAGSIGANQVICNGTIPAALTSTVAGTGLGTISYRWESSTASTTTGFVTIPGATLEDYTPLTALTATTYFRRISISTDAVICESAPAAVVTITVQDAVTAGSIGTDQVICNNTIPAALTSNAAGTGLGTISYRWESSTASTTTGFVTIPGATLEDYTPIALTATTYFRRISISTDAVICESAPAAVVTITVQDAVTAGVISGSQTICKGSVPTAFTSSVDGTGSGTLSYRWESSVIDGNTGFVAITGATAKGYTPAAVSVTTYFRRVSISTERGTECESVPTTALVVEINSAPVIANQNRTTEEDTMLSSQINGTDEEGDALTYSKNTDPTNGVAVVNADGSYTYMPNPGYSGNDSFTIAVSDGCEISIATIMITVTPGPKPAITVVKTGVFAENYITYSFTVKNTGNVPVFDIMLTDAKLGIVNKAIDVPGGLLPGISITVTEKYVLSQEDKEAGTVSNTATVNAVDGRGTAVKDVSGTAEANDAATVTPVAKPLFAKDDHHEANANKVIKENVLVNDDTMGQDVNKLTVELITQPKNGKLVQNADGTFTYTPNPGFTGTDSYTYRIKDEYGYYSNVATVSFKTNFFDLKVPTLFTPDGDGINETFEIRGLNQFADNELIIVNRWGNEVYRMRNYQNNWNGEGLNEGTYYYLLRVKNTGDQEWVILKGYTTLVRGFRK